MAIVRAIVTDPSVLILDESTANLDPLNKAQVLDKLLLHRSGKTTILISHRPRVIICADWIVLLEQSRLKMQGNAEELRLQSVSKADSQSGNHFDFFTP